MYNDIEHRNPHVREELNYWGKWYHETVGFEGVRLDAVKHQSPEFYKEWLQLLRANTGKKPLCSRRILGSLVNYHF